MIDQVAALRAYEDALTPVEASVRNLRVVTESAAGGADVDRLYQQIVGADSRSSTPPRCKATSTMSAPASMPRSRTWIPCSQRGTVDDGCD